MPNSARTIFSPSPTHLLVSEEALMLKKVQWHMLAIALPSRVFPVPGGPKSSSPRGTLRRPVKRSGRCMGQMITSMMHFFA